LEAHATTVVTSFACLRVTCWQRGRYICGGACGVSWQGLVVMGEEGCMGEWANGEGCGQCGYMRK